MSSQTDAGRGEGGWGVFLSAHRCPEVDVLPHQNAEPQIPPLCSLAPAEKSSEFTCPGENEADYLDICSTHHSKAEEEEENEGSISDWSEEDLSLHFSPSVIVQSDDESDPESGFECVDITMETQMKGQDGERLKMVPKRQIQLKKKKDGKDSVEQLILKDGPGEGRGVNNDASANELKCSSTHPWPDLLLRQHSMPASFQATSRTSSDADSYKVYKGLIAGAAQGFLVAGNSRRLKKSFSLDETKTKMASCLIKNVLSKKMQVEQNNLKKNPEVSPFLLPPVKQQEGQTGGTGSRAPVHVVRDMRSLVKHTYSRSFTTTTSVSHGNNTTRRFKAIGQEDSPPPTYLQEVGVKGHVSKVAASFSQSQDKKLSKIFSQPITQQRRGSEPIISTRLDLLDQPTMKPNQSERAMTPSPSQETQPPYCAEKQSSILGVTAPSAPCSSQQLLQPTFPAAMHPHLGKVGYVHTPLSYIQRPQPTPDPSNHLPRRFEEVQNQPTENFSKKMDRTKTTQNQEDHGTTATPASQVQPELQQQHHQQQKHHLHPQPFLCSAHSFLPAQVGGDFHVDVSGSAAAPGAYFRVPAPCQLMLDPKSGPFVYADTSLQSQRKMLLDPETGQFFQVFLPAASAASNTPMFPVHGVNLACTILRPTPTVFQVGNATPTLVSVMPFQPAVAVSTIYGPSHLPVTVMTSHPQHNDDTTSLVITDH